MATRRASGPPALPSREAASPRAPQAKRTRPARRRAGAPAEAPLDPHATFLDEWEALTPLERITRSWALRARIPDLQALHDAKMWPRL